MKGDTMTKKQEDKLVECAGDPSGRLGHAPACPRMVPKNLLVEGLSPQCAITYLNHRPQDA